MSGSLRIGLDTRPLERVEADVAIAGVFADERPLRGAAGRADWRLCGLLTRLVLDDRLDASPGAATLVGTSGRLAAPALLVVGLGARTRFGAQALEDATRSAVARAVALSSARAALAPFGIDGDELVRHARALVEGALAGLGTATLAVRLCVPEAEESRVRRELVRVVRSAAIEIEPPAPTADGARAGATSPPSAAPR